MRNRRVQKSRKQKKLKNVDPLYRKEATSTSFLKRKRQDLKEKKLIAAMKEQPIPKKTLELFNAVSLNTERKSKKKNKKNANHLILKTGDECEDVSGHKRSLKCGNMTIQQGLYETDEQFLRRLSKYASIAQTEAEIEDKFDVDFCDQNETETNTEINEEKKKSNRKKKRNERKKLKRKEAKMKNMESDDELNKHDSVKFGEEVEEPPDLSFIKLKKKSKT